MIRFRTADSSDSYRLASVHLQCAKKEVFGGMHKYGLLYLRTYYNILFKEPSRVILIAEEENEILGFVSGTLSAEEHLSVMRNNKFKLAVILFLSFLKHPVLINDIIKRVKKINSNNTISINFISEGPRIDYWGWNSNNKHLSIPLFRSWLKIAFERGAVSIKGDIYAEDIHMVNIHKYNKARFVEEFICHDERKKILIEYFNEKYL